METIVVVNGGDESFVESLTGQLTGVKFVRSAVNRGVPGGYNLGRSVAHGELLVMMHDDVEVERGWLQAWIDASERHPEAGVIGSKVLFPDGRLRGAGSILWSDANTSPPWRDDSPPPDSFATARTVDYSSSCSLLVRAALWDAIGGLNDDLYPAYYVDVDLAMSARSLGWSVLYWPASRVRHRPSSPANQRWRSFVASRNRERFIELWSDELRLQHVNDGDVAGAITQAANWSASSHVIRPKPPRTPSSAHRDDSFYSNKENALRMAYTAHLETSLDATEAALAHQMAARSA